MRLARIGAVVALTAGIVAAPVAASGRPTTAVTSPPGLTMEAAVMLDGHARVGSWMAIDVRLKNDGPPIVGELRITGGTQGRTRFGTLVQAPTQSDQTHRLYAQPPGFGRELEVSLYSGETTIATAKAAYTIHDGTQMVVGIVAERPGDIIGDLDLLPNMNNVKPLTVGLDAADLPTRVEAWGALDRLIWQDVDSTQLNTEQIAALRGWVAGGGRLVIAGGTSGPAGLSAFPDAILPYRPTTTTDVAASSLGALLGEVPDDAKDLPALSGTLTAGRALASVGDQTVAAERPYGTGAVTIIGFDPTAAWLTGTRPAEGLWRRLIPTRSAGGAAISDDSQIVQAASQLPTLALPPVGGLIALLGGYILLIGPVNYLVLRRLDKREWAWVTMPALIVAFAVGAYGFGSLLRGSDIIVNEVAIVRGAPGATEGLAQSYLGVFSPSRGSYQVRVPGGALLSSPISGDFMGVDGNQSSLDVLQGDPSRVRDLGVGFGSLRTIRAESAVTVPLIEADLRLEEGRLKGTVTNASEEVLQAPAVVLGGTVAKLSDLAPGQTASVDVALQVVQMGQQLSDKIVGQIFFGDPSQGGEGTARAVRTAHDHRPTHVRPELGLYRPIAGRRRRRPRLVGPRAAAGRDRGPGRPADGQRPVVPAGRHHGQRQDDVPPGPPPQHGHLERRRVLQQGSVQHRLRPGLGGAVLPADLVRRHDRRDAASDRLQFRRVRATRSRAEAGHAPRDDPRGLWESAGRGMCPTGL